MVQKDIVEYKTLHIRGIIPYTPFTEKLHTLNLHETFDFCKNQYNKTFCGIFSQKLKSNDYITNRLTFAVEEQMKRLRTLRIKLNQLKTEQSVIQLPTEASASNPQKVIVEVRVVRQ